MRNGLVKAVSGPIQKAIEENNERLVKGFYTDDLVDLHGHMISQDAMVKALDDYRNWNTLRLMHDAPIGTVKSIGDPVWNYLEAKISDSSQGRDTWTYVQDGVYKAFSVGILVLDGYFLPVGEIEESKFAGLPDQFKNLIMDIGEVFKITDLVLIENSIVDRPANPRALVTNLARRNVVVAEALPSASIEEGMGAVKSAMSALHPMFAVGTSFTNKNVDSSVENSSDEASQDHDLQDETTEDIVSENEVKDVEKQDAPSESVDEATENVEPTDAVETENEEAEVVENDADVEVAEDVEVDEEPAVDFDFSEVTNGITAVNESVKEVAGSLAELKELMLEFKSLLENVEVVDEEDSEDVSDEPVEDDKALDVEALAKQVADMVLQDIEVRTAPVNTGDEVEDKKIDLKSFNDADLRKTIARMAVGLKPTSEE